MAESRHLVAMSVRGSEDASFTFIQPTESCRDSGWETCEFEAATPSPRLLPLSAFPEEVGVYAVEMLDGDPRFEFVRELGEEDWHG